MKWNLYKHPLTNSNIKNGATVGTLVSIYISNDKKTIKRIYDVNGTTVSGKKPITNSVLEMKKLFSNELHWLSILKNSKYVPALIDYNENEMSLVQEFVGNDLYTILANKESMPKNIVEQLVKMHFEYQKNGLFKGNGDPRNLAIKNNQLVAFDFKWAKQRSKKGVFNEWISMCHFFKRIHPNLLHQLKATFNDFPEEAKLLKMY
jgi:hypothetical protein